LSYLRPNIEPRAADHFSESRSSWSWHGARGPLHAQKMIREEAS
jgi:hypothetical protein